MASSSQEFKRGDRVRLSSEGLAAGFYDRHLRLQGLTSSDLRGTVVGSVARRDGCIRVRLDGQAETSAITMKAEYWEIVQDEPEADASMKARL
jgi:hypothetical protein